MYNFHITKLSKKPRDSIVYKEAPELYSVSQNNLDCFSMFLEVRPIN